MATMLSVTGEVLGVFDTAEATRRVLERGVLLPNFHQKIGAFKSWAEVGLVAATTHPDAQCGTGEVFFLRALADVWRGANKKGKNPIADAFKEELFEPGFRVNTVMLRRPPGSSGHPCPLMILELDWGKDAVSATVLVPEKWVQGLPKTTVESTAWDETDGRDPDDVRARAWRRRDADVRLVEATLRVPPGKGLGSYQAGIHKIAHHEGVLYGAPRTGKLVQWDAKWKAGEVAANKRSMAATDLYVDDGVLWVVTKSGHAAISKAKSAPKREGTETPMSRAEARFAEALPLGNHDGGLGSVSAVFEIDGATWLVTARGALIQLRPGAKPRMFVVSNIPSERAPTPGAAFDGSTFYLAGEGVWTLPLAACTA
jgi:hypothetical protein